MDYSGMNQRIIESLINLSCWNELSNAEDRRSETAENNQVRERDSIGVSEVDLNENKLKDEDDNEDDEKAHDGNVATDYKCDEDDDIRLNGDSDEVVADVSNVNVDDNDNHENDEIVVCNTDDNKNVNNSNNNNSNVSANDIVNNNNDHYNSNAHEFYIFAVDERQWNVISNNEIYNLKNYDVYYRMQEINKYVHNLLFFVLVQTKNVLGVAWLNRFDHLNQIIEYSLIHRQNVNCQFILYPSENPKIYKEFLHGEKILSEFYENSNAKMPIQSCLNGSTFVESYHPKPKNRMIFCNMADYIYHELTSENPECRFSFSVYFVKSQCSNQNLGAELNAEYGLTRSASGNSDDTSNIDILFLAVRKTRKIFKIYRMFENRPYLLCEDFNYLLNPGRCTYGKESLCHNLGRRMFINIMKNKDNDDDSLEILDVYFMIMLEQSQLSEFSTEPATLSLNKPECESIQNMWPSNEDERVFMYFASGSIDVHGIARIKKCIGSELHLEWTYFFHCIGVPVLVELQGITERLSRIKNLYQALEIAEKLDDRKIF